MCSAWTKHNNNGLGSACFGTHPPEASGFPAKCQIADRLASFSVSPLDQAAGTDLRARSRADRACIKKSTRRRGGVIILSLYPPVIRHQLSDRAASGQRLLAASPPDLVETTSDPWT